MRNAANKGYARGDNLRRSLAEAFNLCDWLVAVRVPGIWNAADAPSRNKALIQEHVEATWAVLRLYADSLHPGALPARQ